MLVTLVYIMIVAVHNYKNRRVLFLLLLLLLYCIVIAI